MYRLIEVRTVSIRLVRVRTLAQASTILSYSPHHNLCIRNAPDLISTITPLLTLSTSTLTFIYLTTGTFLSCCSANTLNIMFEPKYDALISRTRNRLLVRGLVSPRVALLFAMGTTAAGLGLLYIGTNPNYHYTLGRKHFIYAFVYTPLKRISLINTRIGAVVGGIPTSNGLGCGGWPDSNNRS